MSQLHEKYNITYVEDAGDDNIIKNKPGYLHSIIIGEFVSGGIIEVSDHATLGDGDVKVCLTTAATDTDFPKVVLVDAHFDVGITSSLTTQTKVSFIWI